MEKKLDRKLAYSKALIETFEEEYLSSVVHEDIAACLQFAKIQKTFSCTKIYPFNLTSLPPNLATLPVSVVELVVFIEIFARFAILIHRPFQLHYHV